MLGKLKDFYPITLNGSAYKTITKLLSKRLRDGLHTLTGLSSRVPLGTSMERGFGTCHNSSDLSAEGGILVSNSNPPCRKQEFHWNTGDKAPYEITKNALLTSPIPCRLKMASSRKCSAFLLPMHTQINP